VPFANLSTPALILDKSAMQRNLDDMHARMRAHGVGLRPHLKTAKSAEVARRAISGQPGGITVSTLAEAEYFFTHGFRDILYAVGIAAGRLDRVVALSKAGADIKIITDNIDAVRSIADYPSDNGEHFKVLVEVDSGEGRAGVLSDGPEFMEIARTIHNGKNMT